MQKNHSTYGFERTSTHQAKKCLFTKRPSLFVVQKHLANYSFYDLKIEDNSILKNWVIPKGPSCNPRIKRLAVHANYSPLNTSPSKETTPLEQYDESAVKIWDKGTWTSITSFKDAYRKGNITLLIKGRKLKGFWKLIRLQSNPKNWLLFKVH